MKLGNIRLRPAVYGVLATTLAWVMTANSVAAAEAEFTTPIRTRRRKKHTITPI